MLLFKEQGVPEETQEKNEEAVYSGWNQSWAACVSWQADSNLHLFSRIWEQILPSVKAFCKDQPQNC